MSLEIAITALAQAISEHAQATVEAAKIYAAAAQGVNTVTGGTVGTAANEPAAETVAAEPAKKSRSTKTKPAVDTPAEPDPEKEPVKEEEVEKPRKAEVDTEKLKDEIRAVFQKLASIQADLPLAVLREQGHKRLSEVPADELAAVLLAAKDKLASVTADFE